MEHNEACAYHALLTALRGNFRTMETLGENSGNWESAWNAWRDAHAGKTDAEHAWSALLDRGIELLLRDDPRYPALLRETPRAPLALYARGNAALLEQPAIAIVGTRKASSQGTALAREWAEALSRAGIAVISGLALGVDAAAHEGALLGAGNTIAVLGNGIDTIYPKTNERLGEKILENGGLILSEYLPGTPALPAHFLERNRIIAGLAKGTLIIEAPARSGTLATARCAVEAGRDVFVVPGPVAHPNFQGSHALIREGAELVRTPDDILESLGVSQTPRKTPGVSDDPTERALLDIFERETGAVRVESLIDASGLSAAEVNRALAFLVMKNAIVESGDGYARK